MMRIILAVAMTMAAGLAQAGESPIAFILAQQRAPGVAVTQRAAGAGHVVMTDEAARRLGVPIAIARAVLRIESGGNCRARSAAGAIGAMQVLPATARALGVYGDLRQCRNSIEAGTRYLAKIISLRGSSCAALSLYNRGEGALPICTGYGRLVLRLAGLS